MSGALTGPTANLGKDLCDGLVAGIERANRAGGIQGRRLRLITLDDGYEPVRAIRNMRQLIEQDHVLAFIGNVGTPTGVAALPIINENEIPFFAPFTGAGAFRRNPPDRYVFNYRASYAEETSAVIDGLIAAGLKLEDIALFTQRDAFGAAGYEGSIAALKRHGLTNEQQVLHVYYERNSLAVENALATLLYAEHPPRAVVMVGAYAPCAKFIRLAHAAGLRAVFHNVSFVGSQSLAAELRDLPAAVVVTQVVPHPTLAELPVVSDYLADMKIVNPAATPNFGALEGYIAARIFVAALERIPGELTRNAIVNQLEALGEFDAGLGEPLSLTATNHQASHRVWLTKVEDGQIVPLAWSALPALIAPSQPKAVP